VNFHGIGSDGSNAASGVRENDTHDRAANAPVAFAGVPGWGALSFRSTVGERLIRKGITAWQR
jgi:hypothetical protein